MTDKELAEHRSRHKKAKSAYIKEASLLDDWWPFTEPGKTKHNNLIDNIEARFNLIPKTISRF